MTAAATHPGWFSRSSAKYFAFARASARRALAERAMLLGRVVFLGVILFAFSRVWGVLGSRAAIGNAGPRELIWYIALTEWAVLSMPQVFLAIEAEVRSGDVACRLVRPVDYTLAHVCESLGESALRIAVLGPCAALYAFLLSGGFPADPRGLWFALPLVVLACLLGTLCMAAIGLSAFWVIDTSPFFWIWQKLVFVLGGLLFPLELYPEWLRRVAQLSPFPLLCWAPGSMALGYEPGRAASLLLQGVVYAGVLLALLAFLSSRARRRLTVNGG
jgi:ABC-2 type transport system permease protein